MEPEGSLLCSQEPVIGPHPEPEKSIPHLSTLFPLDPSFHLHLGLPRDLFPSGFPISILD
jgi:hypothetical protein